MIAKLVLLTVTAVICGAPPAVAEPIVITSGSVFVGAPSGPFPPFGFELLGSNTILRGVTFAERGGFVRLGDTVDLSTPVVLTAVGFGPFEQTVNGEAFTNVILRGALNFHAVPFVASSNALGGFTTAFSMTGEVSLFEGGFGQDLGPHLLTTQLIGSGTASIGFLREIENGVFMTSGTSFRFAAAPAAATPEPATLLLVSGGLWAARRSSTRVLRRLGAFRDLRDEG